MLKKANFTLFAIHKFNYSEHLLKQLNTDVAATSISPPASDLYFEFIIIFCNFAGMVGIIAVLLH